MSERRGEELDFVFVLSVFPWCWGNGFLPGQVGGGGAHLGHCLEGLGALHALSCPIVGSLLDQREQGPHPLTLRPYIIRTHSSSSDQHNTAQQHSLSSHSSNKNAKIKAFFIRDRWRGVVLVPPRDHHQGYQQEDLEGSVESRGLSFTSLEDVWSCSFVGMIEYEP